VRFFTPVRITVEVARLIPRPRREVLRDLSFWLRLRKDVKREIEMMVRMGKTMEMRMKSRRLSFAGRRGWERVMSKT